MSSVTRPQGPLPARVYWVRRAVVLGTAFLLIFGLARLLGSGSEGDGDGARPTAEQAAGQQQSSAAPTETVTSGPDETETTKPKKAKKTKKTKTPLPEPTGDCDPADVTVRPELDTVAWSDEIKVPLILTGVDEACTFEVSSKSLVIKITSGSDLIWTSQQCGRLPADEVVVRSESKTKVVFVWNGRRSDDECSRTADFARPGWYHVEVAALGGEPTSDKFELTTPKPEKVYKTEKPKKGKKKSEKKKDSESGTQTDSDSKKKSDKKKTD